MKNSPVDTEIAVIYFGDNKIKTSAKESQRFSENILLVGVKRFTFIKEQIYYLFFQTVNKREYF